MSVGRDAQFDLYAALEQRDVDVRNEVRLPACSVRSKSGTFVVDLAVYYRKQLVAVCECKRFRRALRGRQLENYEGCGVPYIVAGSDNFTEALMWLSEWGHGRAPK